MDSFFSDLNKDQQKAVKTVKGPLFLLAGAGSGKTRTLTNRIAYLMHTGVSSWNILALTFTNKAAQEMKERVENLLSLLSKDSRFSMPNMGTFHSICVKILRSEITCLEFDSNFVIYDSQDQVSVMKEVLRNLDIDSKKWTPKSMCSKISEYKNNMFSPEYLNENSENAYQQFLVKVYVEYEKILKQNNALDFDNLLFFTLKIFTEFPDILEKYQKRWQYVLVDEYQDTNYVQHAIVKLLVKKHNNICVVGDPDQSIYSFRGAIIANILNFEKDFPEAEIIKLEINYRSTQNILSASNELIQNNTQRNHKNLRTDSGSGDRVQIWELKNEVAEATHIAKTIQNFYRHSIGKFSDNAVLYRTNVQSRVIEEALLKASIPYKIIGGLKFYARKEVKDILAYLRIIINPSDDISLLRIINTPARKIGKSSLLKVQAFAQNKNVSLFHVIKHIDVVDNLTPAAKKVFTLFCDMYEFLTEKVKTQVLSDFIHILIQKTGYEALLKSDKSIENQSRLDNLEELQSVATRYDFSDQALELFLEEVALVQDADSIEENNDAVLLMTIHSAKGLEFNHVFLPGIEEDILPHSQSSEDPDGLEEERRLMYVAMTRAKQQLIMSHAEYRTLYGKSIYPRASRFLGEIPEKYCEYHALYGAKQLYDIENNKALDSQMNNQNHISNDYVYDEDSQSSYEDVNNYEIGLKVRHHIFGEGTIIDIQGLLITISFGPGNVKKIASNIVALQII
jgi:DNA helicase II / ATP-dependent DNA helicase PcrA